MQTLRTLGTKVSSQIFVNSRSEVDKRLANADKPAVQMIDVHKQYGSGKRAKQVIIGLDMTVERGEIYGLLGPSGCGKTTLLSIILGQLKPNSGSVHVFGYVPGDPEGGVPGRSVGYMPQALALFEELTIKETLRYFAYMFNMKRSYFRRRLDFLVDLLKLPSPGQLIKHLSGGQQRRVSFAVAMLHEPQLLILDEPTVGVDPLLRKSIWNHLVSISQVGNVTTVITTHYIEESRQAHKVGMMRNGKLLAEEAPDRMIRRYNKTNLEEVFLHLALEEDHVENVFLQESSAGFSQGDEFHAENVQELPIVREEDEDEEKQHSTIRERLQSTVEEMKVIKAEMKKPRLKACGNCCSCPSIHRLCGLFMKNFLRLWRKVGYIMFAFIFPSIQVAIFCLAVGGPPQNVPFGIVNHDSPDPRCFNKSYTSCVYIDLLKQTTMIKIKKYRSLKQAIDRAHEGDISAIMVFPYNYTVNIRKVQNIVIAAETPWKKKLPCSYLVMELLDLLNYLCIRVYLDVTDQQTAFNLRAHVMITQQKLTKHYLDMGNISIGSLAPIEFGEPLYGSENTTFTDYMGPGMILSMTYFFAVGLTAMSLILEKAQGLLERTYIAGGTDVEIMISHLVSQMIILVGQVVLVLIIMLKGFNLPCEGSYLLAAFLTTAQGFCGMAYGLLLSVIANDEQTAIQLTMGSVYPSLMISGILWPLSAMPEFLQKFCMVLPQTIPCEGFRSILLRGWGMEHFSVYMAFVVTVFWTVIFFLISSIILNCRRM